MMQNRKKTDEKGENISKLKCDSKNNDHSNGTCTRHRTSNNRSNRTLEKNKYVYE